MGSKCFLVVISIFLILAFSLTSTKVLATSFSNSQVTIDWGSLAVSWNNTEIFLEDDNNSPIVWRYWPDPAGTGNDVPAKGDQSSAFAVVGEDSVDDEDKIVSGWGATSASVGISPVQSSAATTEENLLIASSSSAPYYATYEDRARAGSSAWRNGHFIVLDENVGTLDVSINYTYSLDRNMDNLEERLGSMISAYLHVGLYDGSGNSTGDWEHMNEVVNFGESAVYGSDLSGSLYLQNIELNPGETGYIGGGALSGSGAWDVRADTEPVFEPSTLLLLGSGLIGLAGLRRLSKLGDKNEKFDFKSGNSYANDSGSIVLSKKLCLQYWVRYRRNVYAIYRSENI